MEGQELNLEMNPDQLVLNRIRTPDGTILTSKSRHDYQIHIDDNGLEYMVDGGLDYLRRNVHKDAPYEELSVTLGDGFNKVREALEWGSFGKEGQHDLIYKPVCQMSNAHIDAILDNNLGADFVRGVLEHEWLYREKKRYCNRGLNYD